MAGSRTRVAVALTVAIAAVGGLGAPAGAHGDDPTVGTVLDTVEPSIPGVTVQVVESVSAQLVAENTTATELEVLAETGEPFLRIGPDGVHANLASPSWYLSNSPSGAVSVPAGVAPDAEARWARVTSEHAWGWFDHRLHPAPPEPGRAGTGKRTLARWTVPMRYGEREVTARGRVVRRRTPVTTTAALRRIEPAVDGLSASVLGGAVPAVFLTYSGAQPIVVVGALGEPFARFGPTGVEVNLHSETWIDNARARDQDVSGLVGDPSAPPEWVPVAAQPSFAWLDLRGALAEGERRLAWRIPVETDQGVVVLVAETRRLRAGR